MVLLLPWQAKMRLRAFKLIGYCVPIVIIALTASSFLPSTKEKVVLEKTWGESILVRGRIELPKRNSLQIPTAWIIEGPMPKPKSMILDIRTKTLDGTFDQRRRWNFAPQSIGEATWRSVFYSKVPAGEVVAFRIRAEQDSDIPPATTLNVVTDPARPLDKWLRILGIMIYPASALLFFAIVMLLFARFYQL